MRKIETLMNKAVATQSERFVLDNTTVLYVSHSLCSMVLLHNNLIATIQHGYAKIPTVHVNFDMFKQWPTRTTASRLRALGVNASLKQGMAAIDGVIL